jgi:hypothetical protein
MPPLLSLFLLLLLSSSNGFELKNARIHSKPLSSASSSAIAIASSSTTRSSLLVMLSALSSSKAGEQEDLEFSAFASKLLDVDEEENAAQMSIQAPAAATARAKSSSSFQPRRSSVDQASTSASSSSSSSSWKRDLDELLDLTTSNARRQMLLQRLLSSPEDIRSSVEQALRDRKVKWSFFQLRTLGAARNVT